MISEGLSETIKWFGDGIRKQHHRIARLERSLFLYKAGFWSLVILLAAFIVGALLEVW